MNKLTIVSIPNLVRDVNNYVRFQNKFRFYDWLNRLFLGFFFNDRKMHYYTLYISSMRKLEKRYRRLTITKNVSFYPVIPDGTPLPTAPHILDIS